MDFDNLFSSLEEKYGLPKGYLSRTRQIESSNGKNVYNPNSGAAGDFQFIPKTARQYGLTNPYDINQSADAAARLAADNAKYLREKGIEPDAAKLYLAHQQGAGGAAKLLTQGDAPAADLVGRNAVGWNGGGGGQTGGQFAQQWLDKYNGGQGGGYQYSAKGGLNSPREQIAMANPGSAPPEDPYTKIGDAPRTGVAGLLDQAGVTDKGVKGAQGLLGGVAKMDTDAAAANNAQNAVLWQMAAKGGNTQPMQQFMGFKNIFGNGLLG